MTLAVQASCFRRDIQSKLAVYQSSNKRSLWQRQARRKLQQEPLMPPTHETCWWHLRHRQTCGQKVQVVKTCDCSLADAAARRSSSEARRMGSLALRGMETARMPSKRHWRHVTTHSPLNKSRTFLMCPQPYKARSTVCR